MINPVSPLPDSIVLPAQGGVAGAPDIGDPLFMQLLEALIGASGELASESLKGSQAVDGAAIQEALPGAMVLQNISGESSTDEGSPAGEPAFPTEHEKNVPGGAVEALLALLSAAGRLQPSQIIASEIAPAVSTDGGIVSEIGPRPNMGETTPGVATPTTVPFAEAPDLLTAGNLGLLMPVPAAAPPLPPPASPVGPAGGIQAATSEVYEAPGSPVAPANVDAILSGWARPAGASISAAGPAAREVEIPASVVGEMPLLDSAAIEGVNPARIGQEKPLQGPAAGQDGVQMPVYSAASAQESGTARPATRPAPAAAVSVDGAGAANQPAETSGPAGRGAVIAARSLERAQDPNGAAFEGAAGRHVGPDSLPSMRPDALAPAGSASIEPARQDDAIRLLRASVVDQIARRAHLFSEGGRFGLSIQLEPADLGKVQVHVGFGSDGLQVKLAAENRDTMSVIQAALPQLKDALESQGLRIESFGLALGAGLPGFDNARDSGQPRQWLEAQPVSPYYLEMDPAGEELSRRESTSPESLIDYRV